MRFLVISYDDDQQKWYYDFVVASSERAAVEQLCMQRDSVIAADALSVDACYSCEELVAEMGAAFLAGYCGIENRTINNSAAYLANWLDALKNDSRMVLVAASQAQKAADLILGVTPSDTGQHS